MLRHKIKIVYSRQGDLRFISHLDTLRMFMRAFRRAEIELRLTEGFNPHPRMSFALPLSVGVESKCEVMFVETARVYEPDEIVDKLSAVLPEGIKIISAEKAASDGLHPVEVEYEATLPQDADTGAIAAKIGDAMSRQVIEVTRIRKKGDKRIDLRPLIESLTLKGGKVYMKLRVTAGGTAKPEEVLQAIDAPNARALRLMRTALQIV